jgi:hypothetical protein
MKNFRQKTNFFITKVLALACSKSRIARCAISRERREDWRKAIKPACHKRFSHHRPIIAATFSSVSSQLRLFTSFIGPGNQK